LLPFFEHYNWGCKCCTSVIMTWLLVMKGLNQLFYHTTITKHEHDKWLWPTHTLIHDVTTKYPKPAKPQRLSICNLFSQTNLLHMTTSEESLRVLFFTLSLTIDLVH
jgi:hypothetical protein